MLYEVLLDKGVADERQIGYNWCHIECFVNHAHPHECIPYQALSRTLQLKRSLASEIKRLQCPLGKGK